MNVHCALFLLANKSEVTNRCGLFEVTVKFYELVVICIGANLSLVNRGV